MSPKPATPLLDQHLAPAPVPSQALTTPHDDGAALFERLARDESVSVDKLERLVALWERGEAKRAEAKFNAAMAAAQKDMRPVATDAYNPSTKSKYASYEALDRALRPLYTHYGFALSFNTGEAPQPDYVRVLCKVSHVGGHAEPYHVDMPADGKGAKGGDVMTKTHATGSALSYGQRYLLKMIFNVATGEGDDDGNAAAGQATHEAPKGFEDWLTDLTAVADEGLGKLTAAWNGSKVEYRNHLLSTNKPAWDRIKEKAKAVRS